MTKTSITGDVAVMDFDHCLLIQQVNCHDVMDAGIALAIRQRFPQVYADYHRFCAGRTPTAVFGDSNTVNYTITALPDSPHCHHSYVANLFSQKDFGRDPNVKYTNETKLINGMCLLANIAKQRHCVAVVPQQIGAGLGNGDVNIIANAIAQIPNLISINYQANYASAVSLSCLQQGGQRND